MATYLPLRARQALAVLRPHLQSTNEGLPAEEVLDVLTGEDSFSESEAAQLLVLLENRGYIYQVNNNIRITHRTTRSTLR